MGCSTSNVQILRKKMMSTKETKTMNGSNFKRDLKKYSLQNDDKVYDHTIAKTATDETLSTTSTNHIDCIPTQSSEINFLSSGKVRRLEKFESLTVSEKINKLREKISPIKEEITTDKVISSTTKPEVPLVVEDVQEKNKNSRHAEKLKRFEQLSTSEKISNLRKMMSNSPHLLKGKNSPNSIRKRDYSETTSGTSMKRSSPMSSTNARTSNKRPNVSSLERTKSDYSLKKQRLKNSDYSEVNKENDENNTAQTISLLVVSSEDRVIFGSMLDSLVLSSSSSADKDTGNANNATNNAQIADNSVNITLKNRNNSVNNGMMKTEKLVLKENTSLNKKQVKRLIPVGSRYKNVKPRVYDPRPSKYILPNKNSEKTNLSKPKLRSVSSAIMAPNNIKYDKGSTVSVSKPLKKTKSFR